jgi:hypothetical protein
MEILANIGQEKYFQISGVNGVFAGLWVGKAIFGATPIHLAARNQGKAIGNGFQACGTTSWRRLPHNLGLYNIGVSIDNIDRLWPTKRVLFCR